MLRTERRAKLAQIHPGYARSAAAPDGPAIRRYGVTDRRARTDKGDFDKHAEHRSAYNESSKTSGAGPRAAPDACDRLGGESERYRDDEKP